MDAVAGFVETIMNLHTIALFLHLVFAAVWVGGLFAWSHGARLRPSVFLASAGVMGLSGLYLLGYGRPDLLREGLFHLKLAAFGGLSLLALYLAWRPAAGRGLAWAGFGLGLLALFAIAALP